MKMLRSILLAIAIILLIAAAASYLASLLIGDQRISEMLLLLVAAFGVAAFFVVLLTLPLGIASGFRETEEAWVGIAAHCGGVVENARTDTTIRESLDRHFPGRLDGVDFGRVVSGRRGDMEFRVLEGVYSLADGTTTTRVLVFVTDIGRTTVQMRVSPRSLLAAFLPSGSPAGWSRFTEPDGNVRHQFLVECPAADESRARDLVRRYFLPRIDELRDWTFDFDGADMLAEAPRPSGSRFSGTTSKGRVQTWAIESLTTALSVAVAVRDARSLRSL